jgi:hypothetical protein
MSRRKAEDVEIFNFSFLDILACTIGALTFILTIMLLNISSSFDESHVKRQLEEELARLTAEIEIESAQVATLEQRQTTLSTVVAELSWKAVERRQAADRAEAQAKSTETDAQKSETVARELARQQKTEQDRLQRIEADIERMTRQRDVLLSEQTKLEAQQQQLVARLDELRKKDAALTAEYEAALAAQQQQQRLLSQVATLKSETAGAREEKARLQAIIDEVKVLNEEQSKLESSIADSEQELQRARDRQAAMADLEKLDNLTSPPWWVLAVVSVVTVVLLLSWLKRRAAVGGKSPDQLRKETADARARKDEADRECRELEEALKNVEQRVASDAGVAGLQEQVTAAEQDANEASDDRVQAEGDLKEAEQELGRMQSRKNESRRGIRDAERSSASQVTPRAIMGPGGAKRTPTHVECVADALIIHPQKERVPQAQIGSSHSAYGKLVRSIAKDKKQRCLVLWVRPNGYDTFRAARDTAQESKAGLGWEPADREWNFVFGQETT